MMPDYLSFSAEELARDDFFVRWVLYTDVDSEAFWREWIETFPHKRDDVDMARQMVLMANQLGSQDWFGQEDTMDLLRRVQVRLDPVVPIASRKLSSFWLPVAASILLVLTVSGWFLYDNTSRSHVESNEVAAQIEVEIPGFPQRLITAGADNKLVLLDDGSIVVLSPNSELHFPQRFGAETREVELTGSAFFEIAHDSSRPFWVHGRQVKTKVLGTSFWVKQEEKSFSTTVLVKTGRVAVFENDDERNPVLLSKTERAVFTDPEKDMVANTEDPISPSLDFPMESIAFNYVNEPLVRVLEDVEKAYGVKISYDETAVDALKITASLGEESLLDKLRVISKFAGCHYELSNHHIYLRNRD
jgi:transmembrane sensor